MALREAPRRTYQEPVEATVNRLQTFVGRMERRYECQSAFMAEAVRTGSIRDTAEIARWLSDYRTLLSLRELAASEGPTGTTTTV